jgi:hypothetical protein
MTKSPIQSPVLAYHRGSYANLHLGGGPSLVFGIVGPTADEKERFDRFDGDWVPWKGKFACTTGSYNKCDIDELTQSMSVEWLKILQTFNEQHKTSFANLIFDRATFRQFFVMPTLFTKEEYAVNCHLHWNVNGSPNFDYRKEYPQRLMTVLLQLMCCHLLRLGGSLIVSTESMESDLLASIVKMFTRHTILPESHTLVVDIIRPNGPSDDLDRRIALFQGFKGCELLSISPYPNNPHSDDRVHAQVNLGTPTVTEPGKTTSRERQQNAHQPAHAGVSPVLFSGHTPTLLQP